MARSSKPTKRSTKQPDKTEDVVQADDKAEEVEVTKDESADTKPMESNTDSSVIEDAEIVPENASDAEAEDVSGDEGAVTDADNGADQHETTDAPGVIPAHSGPAASIEPVTESSASSGPGTMSLIFGGLLAGLIGFLVATFAVPDGWPNAVSSSDDGIEEQLSTQEAQIAELTEELRNLRDAPASTATTDLTPLQDQLSGFEATLSDSTASVDERFESLSSFLGGLEERLVLLEERPVDGSGAAGSAAMEAQLEQFRQQLDDVTADAEARITEAQNRASEIEAEAAEAAVEAERRAALSTLRAALENGTSFSDTLQVFDNPPKQLSAIAADGAPTLSRLQSEFPAAARRALSEVRSVPVDASTTEKFTAFLKRQTNARSLAPKDGDDPDAILSRAEAAVSEGDLETATAELSALPDDARAAMSEWISAAETRAAALNAVGTLENTLN